VALYLDTSALVKLVIAETESEELRQFVGHRGMVSSQVTQTELVRAVNRADPDRVEAAEELLADISFFAVDRLLTIRAGWVRPASVRSLDAIHIASAVAMQGDLETLVTYDKRMIEAAQTAGLPVASPGASAA
jgi:predicted nucleic acid-binding protein